ncbi:MAG: hypothetical protein JO104_09690 [Candidatus Eremiobacteraeota bacterium]|nr:hypothetical protein [Candidatus Eremiobacteraeota bacterium]
MPHIALADVHYDTAGEDIYRIESAGTFSRVSYGGTERLSIQREGHAVRFTARARYRRDGPDGKSQGTALFVQMLLPNGSFEDRVDDDPDFLTILNQPFAVRLDSATLRDLRGLHDRIPFSANSPLGGDTVLRGFLRPGVGGPVDGRPAVAVRFEADGAMSGALPGHADAVVSGHMRMDGTAYYALDDATLLALGVTLTLDARLSQGQPSVSVPVRITYRRSIRATSKTLPPAPLATGAGTAAPATP